MARPRAAGDGESIGKYEQADGVLAAAFRHSTSRANDPQLHTHLAILNRLGVVRDDGTVHVGALDGKAFAPIKEAIASAYGRALEQLITEATGARFAMRPDGKAREISGRSTADDTTRHRHCGRCRSRCSASVQRRWRRRAWGELQARRAPANTQ